MCFFTCNRDFTSNRNVFWSFKFTSGGQSRLFTIDLLNLFMFHQPGVVAHACNPDTWRLGSLICLRWGFLGVIVLCIRLVGKVGYRRANQSRVEAQQAKASVSNSSGIAPVRRRSFTARLR